MNFLYLMLALSALPLVFLTLYTQTAKGQKVKLGSFFIIKDFSSKMFKVRNFKDFISMLLRIAFVALMALLIFDYQKIKEPKRKLIAHKASQKKDEPPKEKKYLKRNFPTRELDSFDEDIYFLESFLNNYPPINQETTLIYAPDDNRLSALKTNLIIFPSQHQARHIFGQWADILSLSSLQKKKTKIKGTDLFVQQYFRLIISDSEKVTRHLSLEDGTVIAASFKHQGQKVLIFGVGLASFWGDLGISGYFINIIDNFFIPKQEEFLSWSDSLLNQEQSLEQVKSQLPFDLLIKIGLLIFLLEFIFFALKKYRFKTSLSAQTNIFPLILIVTIFLFTSLSAKAQDFTFIELRKKDNHKNKAIFALIKKEISRRTSIRISPDFHQVFLSQNLARNILPEIPFLWIFPEDSSFNLSETEIKTLEKFIQRGGIIFIDLPSLKDKMLLGKILGDHKELTSLNYLPRDHALYRSFYLVSYENLLGLDVSKSTQRTAIIVSTNNLRRRLLQGDEMAIRTAINVLLYMLSGNYKSDQIHTRQILKKLKQRELFK